MTAKNLAPIVYLETSPTGEEGSWSEFKVCTFNEEWVNNNDGTTITLTNIGDKVYFRAKQENERFGTSLNAYNNFVMTGKIAASGNLNTLLKADGSVVDLTGRSYCYGHMFYYCESLTQAPELPARILAEDCYSSMFNNCTSLTQAPELPATELASYCYGGMFADCLSLTQAPELPATTLAEYCYDSMFYGCTSLTQAPELKAETLARNCYSNMFIYCSSLSSAPELLATTLAERCYSSMFFSCISLTQAPKLKAETLAENCYKSMFMRSGIPSFTVDMTTCTSVPTLPSTTLFGLSAKPYTILVPASLYDKWIQATNWSTIASNIQAV